MEKVKGFFSGVKDVFDYNGATLSGALDVVVVKHPDGSLHASPFSVRFGKFKVFKTKKRDVRVRVNDVAVVGLGLYLASNGKVFMDTARSASQTDQEIAARNSLLLQSLKPREEFCISRTATASTDASGNIEVAGEFQFSLCGNLPEFERNPIGVFHSNRISAEKLKACYPAVRDSGDLRIIVDAKLFTLSEIQEQVEKRLFGGEDPRSTLQMDEVETPRSTLQMDEVETQERTFTLTSEQLHLFQLHPECNRIEYSVTTSKGTSLIEGLVYLMESTVKLVISDIDGTITRSNVLGHVLPKFNKDWSQKGVCQLFQSISRSGFRFVYLTARAIGQSKGTRDYIGSVLQDGTPLPLGPIITSPYRLFASFVREVITHRSQNFKTDMLLAIRNLFPEGENPLYAGFGNNESDSAAYRLAGIPENRIFIVDYGGKVRVADRQTNFAAMSKQLNLFFSSPERQVEEGRLGEASDTAADNYAI